MWDILLQNSPQKQSAPVGAGIFDPSFFQTSEKDDTKETVETEIFHHSTRAVDTSDGGQALPPYSSATNGGSPSKNERKEGDGLGGVRSVPGDSAMEQYSSLPDHMMWPGPALRGDGSLMDLAHDPFFQFQDHQSSFMGIWEIGNL